MMSYAVAGHRQYRIHGLAPLIICCCTLLYGEYRLTLDGVACAIPAMLLAGIARSLHQNSERWLNHAIDRRLYTDLFFL